MSRRLLAIVVIPLALVAASVLDARHDRPVRGATVRSVQSNDTTPTTVAPRTVANASLYAPVVAAPTALDSAWFCVAGTATSAGGADATIVVVNSGTQAAHLTYDLVNDQGAKRSLTDTVDAESRRTLHVADQLQGNWVAATVTADRGQVAVALSDSVGGASAVTPCASRASTAWYFAAGSTDRGATETLALYNPYPEDASANITLQTDAGLREPSALQGVPVPAGSLVMVPLNDTENRRTAIAASITAPIGRIVVSRIQSFSGQGPNGPTGAPPKGLSVALGVPSASTSWTWPYGVKQARGAEQYWIYNPGADDADVEVDIALADPAANGKIKPIAFTVQSGDTHLFDVNALNQVPAGVNVSVTIRTTNDQPVVAERIGMVSSLVSTGVSFTPGSPLRSTRWILPANDLRNGHAYATIVNPGTDAATVTVRILNGASSTTSPATKVGPGDRYDIDLVGLAAGQDPVLLVTSDRPVVAASLEAQINGISLAVGQPEIGTITLP